MAGTARRSGFVLVDQAISSASNFLLVILVGRWLGPSTLGTLALALTVYLLVFGVFRALVEDPMVVMGEAGRGLSPYLAATAILGLASSAGLLVVAIVIAWAGGSGGTLGALAIFLPALLLQDFWRRVGFMRGRARASALNDFVFLVVQVVCLAVAHSAGVFSAPVAVSCWGMGALAGATAGFFQFRPERGPIRSGVQMLRAARGMSTWLVLDYLANRWSRQAVLFIVAGVSGAAVVGGIQASSNLMGTTNPLNLGATASALADGSARMRDSGKGAMTKVVWHAAVMLSVAVGAIAVVYALLAGPILGSVYGAKFHGFVAIAPIVAATTFVQTLDTLPMVRMRITQRTRPLFLARFLLTPIGLITAWLLCSRGGEFGAAFGVLVVSLAIVIGAWIALILEARHESGVEAVRRQIPQPMRDGGTPG